MPLRRSAQVHFIRNVFQIVANSKFQAWLAGREFHFLQAFLLIDHPGFWLKVEIGCWIVGLIIRIACSRYPFSHLGFLFLSKLLLQMRCFCSAQADGARYLCLRRFHRLHLWSVGVGHFI